MTSTTKPPKVLLRWKRQPNESGLRRVVQGPRGWDLYDGKERLACVRPLFGGLGDHRVRGWYFHTSTQRIPHRNTCGEAGVTAPDVLKSCGEYVVSSLRAMRPDVAVKVHARIPGVE